MSTFDKRFKRERKANGITQTDIADIIGVDRTSISKYENGKQLPEIPVLEKIAEYFEVSSDYLLGRTDIKSNQNDSSEKEDKEKDIEKIIDELMQQQGLMLCGQPMNEDDLMLLRNSIRSTIEMAKNMKNK